MSLRLEDTREKKNMRGCFYRKCTYILEFAMIIATDIYVHVSISTRDCVLFIVSLVGPH